MNCKVICVVLAGCFLAGAIGGPVVDDGHINNLVRDFLKILFGFQITLDLFEYMFLFKFKVFL